MNNKPKALILSSGGLDSTLICYIMAEQKNIESTILFFSNPFDLCSGGCSNKSLVNNTAQKLNMKIRTHHLDERFLKIIESPEHGYGKNMNPCIDCRIHMFKIAGEMLKKENYNFIVTGEVVGQRPMSQFMRMIKHIAKEADLKGKVLRPLTAKNLEPTIAETEGLIDREKMHKFTGRTRKPQMELADKYKVNKGQYLTPAGGCRLTMKEYSEKVRDLIENNGSLEINDVVLLAWGRHFRIDNKFKVIVGRNQEENEYLDKFVGNNHIKMWAKNEKGPLCIGIGEINDDRLQKMAGLCGRYADVESNQECKFTYKNNSSEMDITTITFDQNQILKYKIY